MGGTGCAAGSEPGGVRWVKASERPMHERGATIGVAMEMVGAPLAYDGGADIPLCVWPEVDLPSFTVTRDTKRPPMFLPPNGVLACARDQDKWADTGFKTSAL